jgi:hypothetical protein
MTSVPLLERLLADGLQALDAEDVAALADQLDASADRTGLAAPVIVAQTLRQISAAQRAGRTEAQLPALSEALIHGIADVESADPVTSATAARALAQEVNSLFSNCV